MNLLQNLTDFSWVSSGAAWIGLVTLVVLEVVLGIDNIVFISILTGKLPEADRAAARKRGLVLAVIPRILFLLLLGLILSLEHPLFSLPFEDPQAGHLTSVPAGTRLGISGKDFVMLVGGLFLIVQAVREIHHKIEGDEESGTSTPKVAARMGAVMIQIMLMNIIFSLDSIITAVGMVKEIPIMIIAVLISTALMMVAVNPISDFVERHPAVKMLALAFLLLIGTNLLAEAAHFHIPKGYVYFAMAFSVVVEVLNIRASTRARSAEAAPETGAPPQGDAALPQGEATSPEGNDTLLEGDAARPEGDGTPQEGGGTL